MIRYAGMSVSFSEVPDRVALVFYISGCPRSCPGCHSPQLQKDIGMPLTVDALLSYCKEYLGMFDCVCFMGEGKSWPELARLMLELNIRGIPSGVYTGADEVPYYIKRLASFVKTGPYIESKGALTSPTTNQRFYQIAHKDSMTDVTYKFQVPPFEEEEHDC